VAIVGVAATPYSRDLGARTAESLALEAARNAILDAGLTARDIDGVCGDTSAVSPLALQGGLGIPEVTWYSDRVAPFSHQLMDAINAVYSGACSTALLAHGVYRRPGAFRAELDPFRRRQTAGIGGPHHGPESAFGAVGYALWASRYLHEYDATREHLGLVAINNRTNAGFNDHAVMRDPLTMQDYLVARMVREPLCLYDMDLPIDGADAFVVTTAERAADLRTKPVLVHGASFGQTWRPEEELTLGIDQTGQPVAAQALWAKSELTLADIDVSFPYDGFTIITLKWLESVGYCRNGEAGPFLQEHWDVAQNRVMIDGRVPLNTHGGSLSEGGTQGAGHFREATVQLRGTAGARQVPDCNSALVTPGGFFFNSSCFILRTD
jgi:acetyl-CoA acetyltransferase